MVRPASGNPRRTKRVQFTCNMCGETTVKMVNPHAWEKGTVFAQCSGCNVKHKLIGEALFYPLLFPRQRIVQLPHYLEGIAPAMHQHSLAL